MGCCNERVRMNAEERVLLFEKSLGFSMIKATQIETIFYKFSRNQQITFSQFKEICEKLTISDSSLTYEFLMLFINPETRIFSSQELITLGTLLADGTTQEKVSVLFRNYDIHSEGVLKTSEIQLMARHIIEIATDIILQFVCMKTDREVKLEVSNYRNELFKSKGMISYVFVHQLIRNKTEIGVREFYEAFENLDTKESLSVHKIRTVFRKRAENMMELAEKVKVIVQNNLEYDKDLARRLSIKISNQKTRTSKRTLSTKH